MKRKKTSKPAAGSFAAPEIQQIEQLLQFMTEHNLEEFEYSRGDLRIRLRKPSAGVVLQSSRSVYAPEIIVAGRVRSESPDYAGTQIASAERRRRRPGQRRSAPDQVADCGNFLWGAEPGAEAFVKVGSHVECGQTLCIVEAMKLMNEIESDASGEVIRVYVENGQPVEYGQPLFGIRPSRKK